MAVRIGGSALCKAVLSCALAACAHGTELQWFSATGTVTMLPAPPLHGEITFTWQEGTSGYPEISGDPWCDGCYIGTVIVEPPKISLPPGSTVSDPGGELNVEFGVPGYPEIPFPAFVNAQVRGHFFDVCRGISHIPPEKLGAALSSDGQLPPLICDLTYYGPLPGPSPTDMNDLLGGYARMDPPPPDGFQLVFAYDFAWIPDPDAVNSVSLLFAYEVAPVPEPSTALLFLLGAAALVLNRARRIARSPIAGAWRSCRAAFH